MLVLVGSLVNLRSDSQCLHGTNALTNVPQYGPSRPQVTSGLHEKGAKHGFGAQSVTPSNRSNGHKLLHNVAPPQRRSANGPVAQANVTVL